MPRVKPSCAQRMPRANVLCEHRIFSSDVFSGLTHAKIETLAQNAIGNHLYPSLGFVEVARQVHFLAKL